MARTTGNIRLLKPKAGFRPPQDPIRDLEQKMDERLGRMEEEIRGALHGSKRAEPDVEQLIKNLGREMQELKKELKPNASPRPNLTEWTYAKIGALLDFLSIESFKKLLSASWLYPLSMEDLDVDEFGMDPSFIRIVKPFFDFLYYQYWRISTHGLQNIPDKGRGIIISNHSGTLPYDGMMVRLAVENDHPSRRNVRFLVEDFVYHFPFMGTLMYRIGGVRACQENAMRLLNTDHLITVFPEGVKGIGKEYKDRYHLQRFGRGGFVRLALKTRSPIIPTAVIGAEEIHPIIHKSTLLAKSLGIPYLPITPTFPLLGILGLIPLPSKWTISFGEPIDFKEYGPKDADDPILVNKLSEMVRVCIQDMISEGLKKRNSVLWG